MADPPTPFPRVVGGGGRQELGLAERRLARVEGGMPSPPWGEADGDRCHRLREGWRRQQGGVAVHRLPRARACR